MNALFLNLTPMPRAQYACAWAGAYREHEAAERLGRGDIAGALGSFNGADRHYRDAFAHIAPDPEHVARLVRRM